MGLSWKKKLFIKISKKSIVFPYKNLVFNCWEKCYQSKIQKNIRHTTKIILKKKGFKNVENKNNISSVGD